MHVFVPETLDEVLRSRGLLNKLDIAHGSYVAEFILTIVCDKEPCKGDITLSNGKVTSKEKIEIEKESNVGKARLYLNSDGLISSREVFDSAAPLLPEFAPRQAFAF